MQTVTVAQMRALEAEANAKGLPYAEMMRRAGAACGQRVLTMLNSLKPDRENRVVFLIGPGNNGGDGLVCAAALKRLLPQALVVVYIWERQHLPEAESDWPQRGLDEAGVDSTLYHVSGDADSFEAIHLLMQHADIVVDALFGAGQRGPFPADLEAILQALRMVQANQPTLKVVAVDIPTGIDADTGVALSENYVRADLTCTFAYAKPGLLQGAGKAAAGEIMVSDIGFSEVGVGL